MITLRPAAERGHTDIGWLDGRHSFSFGEWYDPRHMGYRTLRVINDDRVAPASGFAMHGHRDMEIVTVVLEGALRHVDSLGHEGVLRAGDVQAMSAGSGVRHSEWNASETEGLHLLQIWILPRSKGTPAWYADGRVPLEERRGRLVLAVAGDRCGVRTTPG